MGINFWVSVLCLINATLLWIAIKNEVIKEWTNEKTCWQSWVKYLHLKIRNIHCQVTKLLPKANTLLCMGTPHSTDILWQLEEDNLSHHIMNYEDCQFKFHSWVWDINVHNEDYPSQYCNPPNCGNYGTYNAFQKIAILIAYNNSSCSHNVIQIHNQCYVGLTIFHQIFPTFNLTMGISKNILHNIVSPT